MRLRRLIVALVAGPALLGATGPATAAQPPVTAEDPTQLPALFAQALSDGPDARACELLVDELRADLGNAESAGLDPYDAATWTPAGLAHACEHWVHEGIRSWDPGAWPDRTTVGTVRVAGVRDGVAHLRVRVLKHRDDGPGLPSVVENVFAERGDDGAWRLAYVGRLLDLYEHTDAFVFLGPERSEDLIVPRRLGDYAAFRRQQIRVEQLQLAKRRREVRAFAAARTPVGAAPGRCAGAQVAGRLAAAARGIRAATLHVEPRALCWTLRFGSDVPRRLGLETDAEQRVRVVVRGRRPHLLGLGADLGVQVRDGTAAGWVAGGDRQTFTRVRAGVRGRTLVVRMPRSALRGRVEVDRPFRWKLTTFPVGAALGELTPGTARAASPTPGQVLRQFVDDAFTLERAEACGLLAGDLRTLYFLPGLFLDEPNWHDPASYTPEAIAANCDRSVAVLISRTLTENSPDLIELRLVRVVTRAIRGDRAHLRVRARGVVDSDVEPDTRTLTDVFLVREDGEWRLAHLGKLSDYVIEPREDGTRRERWWRWFVAQPRTLRHFDGYLRRLAREKARALGERDARLRAMTEARAPVAATPVGCTGASATVADPPRDVRWASGHELVEDQGVPGDDVRSATLWVDGQTVCLEVRLSRPVPPTMSLQLRLSSPGGASGEAALSLDEGVAFVLRESDSVGWVYVRPEVSVAGDTLRVRVPVEPLWGVPEPGRPLRWTVTAFQANPAPPPESEQDTWMDEVDEATLR